MKKSILMMTAGIAIIAALLCLTCDSGRSPSDDDTDANSLADKFRNPNGTDNPPDNPCANGASDACCKAQPNYTGCVTPPATTYAVTVTNGTGGGSYAESATVNITAGNAPDGQQFKQWNITPSVTFTSGSASTAAAAFTMPSKAVTVTANYEPIPVNNYLITVAADSGGIANANVSSASQGTTITLTAAANNGSRFVRWDVVSGGITLSSATAPSATFTMPNNAVSVKAAFEAIKYAVTVVSGTGSGDYAAGATVDIAANTAPSGQRFKNWTSTSSGVTFAYASSPTTSFKMPPNAVTVTAYYEAIPATTYAVTITNGTGGGNYEAGKTVTITANAAPSGQQFKQWNISPAVTFTSGSAATTAAAFTMPSKAVTATAEYEAIPVNNYLITVTADSGGIAIANAASASQGTTITLTAAANNGSRFVRWDVVSGGITLSSATAPSATFTMPYNAVSVKAVFEAIKYAVTVTNGTGGGNYAAGATVDIAADAASTGQQFKNWTTASAGVTFAYASSPTTSFKMPPNVVTVTANYEAIPENNYLITVTADSGGIANANAASASQGTTITLTAAANDGSRFVRWDVVSGGITLSSATAASATFTMPNKAVSVKAAFEAVKYAVTVVSGTGGGNYAAGATVDIAADAASTGQQFKNWTTASAGVTFAYASSPTTSFTMPSSAVTVTAVYEAIPAATYTLQVNRTPTSGGTTSPASPQSNIAAGTAVDISATANSGYTFNNWTLTSGTATFGNANSASTTVTLSANATIQANFATSGGGGSGCTIAGYKTTTIGTQTWMAENLNCDVEGSKCYNNSADSCAKYGRLYTWSDAMKACPVGWHLPSDAEWTILTDYVGGTSLKSTSGWYNNGNGTDAHGFAALPGGLYANGSFNNAGRSGHWLSATEFVGSDVMGRVLTFEDDIAQWAEYGKIFLFSVRCVRD